MNTAGMSGIGSRSRGLAVTGARMSDSRVTFNRNEAADPGFSTSRMMIKTKHATLLMALAATALAPFAAAQFRHPAYLHARSDLRRATLFMRIPDEPNVNRDMAIALEHTEHAIHELDDAARWDRKDLDDHPPIDTHIGR